MPTAAPNPGEQESHDERAHGPLGPAGVLVHPSLLHRVKTPTAADPRRPARPAGTARGVPRFGNNEPAA